MIKIQNNTATREPIPNFLVGLHQDSLLNLSWTDPDLGVSDCAWLPEETINPVYDTATEKLGAEILTIDATRNVVIVTYNVVPLTADDLAIKEAERAKIDAERITKLWQAAHDYEFASLNGSAVGLVTLGIIQSKPKCLAIQGWTAALWTEYYTRKANGSMDTDFTTVGACPHTIPDLMTELGL